LQGPRRESSLWVRGIERQALRESEHGEVLRVFRGLGIYHFEDTSTGARVRKYSRVEDDQQLHEDGGNLAACLYRMKRLHLDVYQRIVSAVRQIAPFFGDFVLVPRRDNEGTILLNWTDQYSPHEFGPDQISDGTLRAICIITLLLQPEQDLPETIVLDEPELGLHPYAIEILASLLRRASAACQIVVATQSISFVNQFQPSNIIVAGREGPSTEFKRLPGHELETWLEDYSVGDLWRKNLIGGTPYR
jgi:predicted ATPase